MCLQPARSTLGLQKGTFNKIFNILDDLVFCSDDNDNDMTFVGHIVYLCPCSIICTLAALGHK